MLTISELSLSSAQASLCEGLNLTLALGNCFVITGNNCSGKTQLLNCLSGLRAPRAGQVQIDGLNLFMLDKKQRETFRKSVGFLTQTPQLSPFQQVKTYLQDLPESGPMRELADRCGLSSLREAKTSDLSFVQQRLLNLISICRHQPKLLFLDQVLLGLDEELRILVIQLIEQLKQQKTTIILSELPSVYAQLIPADARIQLPYKPAQS